MTYFGFFFPAQQLEPFIGEKDSTYYRHKFDRDTLTKAVNENNLIPSFH